MPSRADLLAVADACAAKARALVDGDLAEIGNVERWTKNAHAALEAAGMAAETRDDFERAIADVLPRLERIGVLDGEHTEGLTPAQLLEGIVLTVESLYDAVQTAGWAEAAYEQARAFMERMRDDFEEAGTPTSVRVAERINQALDNVEQTRPKAPAR